LRRPPGHRHGRAFARAGRGRGAAGARRHRRGGRGLPRGAGRPAATRPVHPHRRRHADQQLPAVATRLHRTVVHRYPVARARRRDAVARTRRLRPTRAPLRPDRRTSRRPGDACMTRTRVIAALLMAPLAILAILFLPTPWMAALAAIVFLAGLWEWLKLAEVEDSLHRTILLLLNLLLMVLMVWAAQGSFVLLQIVAVIGVGWWLLALLWLRFYDFASDHDTHARAFKIAAGTLATLSAWCALVLIHGDQPVQGDPSLGH